MHNTEEKTFHQRITRKRPSTPLPSQYGHKVTAASCSPLTDRHRVAAPAFPTELKPISHFSVPPALQPMQGKPMHHQVHKADFTKTMLS